MKIKLLNLFIAMTLSVIACFSDADRFIADAVTQLKKINMKGSD